MFDVNINCGRGTKLVAQLDDELVPLYLAQITKYSNILLSFYKDFTLEGK